MNPATQPIFCLEDYELVNPPRSMEENLSTPYFHIRVKTKDKELIAAAMLTDFVKSCQANAPAEAKYIEQLHWYVANAGRADFMLMQAMEDEGFELERLMRIYLENEPWWEHLRHEGLDNESLREHAILYPESQLPEIAKMLFGWMVNPSLEITSAIAIANAFQAEVWKTYPEMGDLHRKELAGFIEKASKLADMFLTSAACSFEDYVESGDKDSLRPFESEFRFSLEGIKQQISEYRQKSHKKPTNASSIEVEILEMVNVWLKEPSNIVKIWYKATCQEGVFYDFACFDDLVEQAAFHFPAWYHKIEALRENIVAVRPKEKEIVEALLAEHFDFTPLLTSYVNEWVDAQQCLELEAFIRKHNSYENHYDMQVIHAIDQYGAGLAKAQKIILLKDRLEDIAFEQVCQLFPDMIKAAKPWMIKSLKQSAHLLVFEVMDGVYRLISLCEKKAVS